MDINNLLFLEKTTKEQHRPVDIGAPARLLNLSVDKCKGLCDAVGVEYQPGYEQRVLRRVTTTEKPDRMGDIVRADGIDNTAYRKNPVVLFAHQHGSFPVGMSLEENKGTFDKYKGMTSDDLHLGSEVDTTGRSDLVFRFVKSGAMKGGSIGFRPLPDGTKTGHTQEERDAAGLGQNGVEYLKCEKLEHSACAVPANGDALAMAIKTMDLSVFHKEDLDIMEKFLLIEGNIVDIFSKALEPKKTIDIGKGSSSSGKWGEIDEAEANEAIKLAAENADNANSADDHLTASDSHKEAHDAHKRFASKQEGVSKDLHNEAASMHKEASANHKIAADTFPNEENIRTAKSSSKEAAVMSRAAFKCSGSKMVEINFDVKALAEELKTFLVDKALPSDKLKTRGEDFHGKIVALHTSL